MDTTLLFDNFDLLFNSHDSIPALRETILQLAVQGKLVPQDPKDEPSSKLLERIKTEKESLIKQGKLKKEKPLPQISNDAIPFEIPVSWEWDSVGNLCSKVGSGSTPRGGKSAYSDSGIFFLRSQNVYSYGLELNDVVYISDDIHKKMKGTQVLSNDILLNITGGSIGRAAIYPNDLGEANVSQHVCIIRLIDKAISNYFHLLVLSPYFQKMIIDSTTGAGREGLPKNRLLLLSVPLPPLPEQKRIVAKVDELMRVCDDLEAMQKRASEDIITLNTSALAHLSEAKTDQAFNKDWAFISNNFDTLYSTQENVKKLKETILQLAVQGKLVPQDPKDEPASNLLERIKTEKESLIKQGKLKNEKPLPLIKNDEISFDLPVGWAWCKLGELIQQNPRNGYSPKSVAHVTKVKTLKLGATTWGVFNPLEFKYIDEHIPKDSYLWLESNDFLIQRSNSIDYVGVTAIYTGKKGEFIYPDLMMKFKPFILLDIQYLYYALSSRLIRDYFRNKATGSQKSMPKINQGTVVNTLIPLPPLEEQKRIVAKVTSLMAMCNELEQQIAESKNHAGQLMQSVLQEAFA